MKKDITCEPWVWKLLYKVVCFCAPVVFLALISCKDDFMDNQRPDFPSGTVKITEVELPGVFGVNLIQGDIAGTRADDNNTSSDGNSFSDGTEDEYALATPDAANGEYYHYLVIYDNTGVNPLIFPIDVSSPNYDSARPTDHITLTVTKVLHTEESIDLNNNDVLTTLSTKQGISDYLSGKQAYVLLNFKLVDGDNSNYSFNGSTISGTTTPAKIFNLSRTQLEALQMKDYRIHSIKAPSTGQGESGGEGMGDEGEPVGPVTPPTGPPTKTYEDFFIMSNSVYSNGSSKVIDGTFDTSKIFTTETEAKAQPALTAYVERLASKVSVSFNAGKIKAKKFGPIGDDYAISDVSFGANGLPTITTTVRKVDMLSDNTGTGISYGENGYTINSTDVTAYIEILGFGVSNTEDAIRLYKDINSGYGTTWQWNDQTRHRSYWSHDNQTSHYNLVRSTGGTFKKVTGYPHQFRKALETDTVTSYHVADGGYEFNGSNYDEYYMEVGGTPYKSYNQIGEIDLNQNIGNLCYLQYKSFNALQEEYDRLNLTFSSSTTSSGVTTSFSPFYANENTYIDQGMLTGGNTWRWPWARAPYATATNLMVLARIRIKDNYTDDESVKTVYLGQNNIFYLRKLNLLKSKLAILNEVMLSGGNAGIQILNGNWDSHTHHEDDAQAANTGTLLDKVAWNEGSKLWIAKVKWDDRLNGPKNEKKITTDDKGNEIVSYKLEYEEVRLARIDNSQTANEDEQDLDLIPAEISGGDGQCLIAPNPKTVMGKEWRYYLAPEAANSSPENPIMDESQAVEISYNHLVALIHKIIGPVDVYTNGLMYYSVPVPHRYLSYGRDTNTDIWQHMGAFSMVRNNWYDITINEISRLGTPVHVPDQPIIPVMDVKRSYINMGVELKDYHNIKQDNIPMM